MSQTSKIVLGVVVLAIVLGGAYFYWQTAHAPQTAVAPENPETSTLPSGSSTSDTAMDQDLNAIDTQIQAVGTDNANASQSVDAAVQ